MYKPIVNGGCCLGVKTILYDGYNTLKRDLVYEAAFRTISDCKSLPSLPPSVISAELSPPRPLADRKKRTARKSGLMCDPATPTTAGPT